MLMGLLLGILCVTPLVLMYLLMIRQAGWFQPPPWSLIVIAFAWGAFFATFGGAFGTHFAEKSTLALFHVSPKAVKAFGSVVFAPLFEESFKALGVVIIGLALRKLDGPLAGAIYGGVVGLGFTLTEDILYVAGQFASRGLAGFVVLLFLRTVLLGLSHATFTACTGLGLGIAKESRSWPVKLAAPVIGLACAMAMHALHNLLCSFGFGGLVVTLLVSWVIDVLFVVLLAVLVMRDRKTVIRELFGEVGRLVHPNEVRLVSSYFALGFENLGVLLKKGWSAFSLRKKKQSALVALAFVKSRRRRGQRGAELDRTEAALRRDIWLANQRGVWIGA